MTERYVKNYRVLGIPPGTDWKQLRKTYKSLVNTWHPDRFQQNVRQRKLAEERTKEITRSYKELAEYYKKHGVLPLTTKTSATPAADDIPPPVTPEPPPAPESQATPVPEPAPVDALKRWRARAVMAAALVGGAYIVWHLVPWEHPENPPVAEEQTNQAADVWENESTIHRPDMYFTVGSSLGEVYSVQGVPTQTEKDVWYYGKSKVYFVKGKVLRWEESSDNPLRVKITSNNVEMPEIGFFGKGSSKQEVLTVQGTPDRDAGNVWDYGVSRVYFDKDRVTGWHEAPVNPLKVYR